MPSVETPAIVLRTYNLAEADKVVVCFTEGNGTVRGVARGARRLKSRFGAGLEPWTLITLAYFEKEGRELVSIKSAEIVRSTFGLAGDTRIVQTLDYMSELVMEFMPPHEKNVVVFRMMRACMEALCNNPGRRPAIAAYFEIWMLRLAGFLPSVTFCASCQARLNTKERAHLGVDASLRCESCRRESDIQISAGALEHLRLVQRIAPDAYTHEADEQSATDELCGIVRRLTRRALERLPRTLSVKSPAVR